jgi:hypothetical protein
MDKLKPFAVPLVALILLLVWYFVVNPRLAEQPPADDGKAEKANSAK